MPIICEREVSGDDIRRAIVMADLYEMRGFQPLPSRPDAKRPLIKYAEHWESRHPDADFFARPTSNVQVVLGRYWGLMAIDLDGEEAQQVWPTWGRHPKTWITHSGGGGRHVWFRIAKDYPRPLPAAFLWRGEGRHSGIERLCDKSLLMAPPSIHPDYPDRRYRFVARRDPLSIPLPAMAPDWLLAREPVREVVATKPRRPTKAWSSLPPSGKRYRFDQVVDAIADKVAVAESWGLRFTGRVTTSGWAECHAYDRPDMKASAVLHTETGYYVDRGSGTRMGLFDLGVQLGVAATASDVLQLLGDRNVR